MPRGRWLLPAPDGTGTPPLKPIGAAEKYLRLAGTSGCVEKAIAATDGDWPPGLPEIFRGEMPPGNSAIHQHPEAEFIWRLLAILRINSKRGKRGEGAGHTVEEMVAAVEQETGLQLSEDQVTNFLRRHVDPLAMVSDNWHVAALMEADARLDYIAGMAEGAQRMEKAMLDNSAKVESYERIESDRGEKIVRVGPSLRDYVGGEKKLAEVRRMLGEELARIGLAPARQESGVAVQVNVGSGDWRDAARGATRPPSRGVIDAEWRPSRRPTAENQDGKHDEPQARGEQEEGKARDKDDN